MTILKKRLAVLALGLAVTALASPNYARGAGRHIRASDPTTLLAPPTPQAPLENPIPAPPSAPAQAPTINGPLSQPAFRGLTGIDRAHLAMRRDLVKKLLEQATQLKRRPFAAVR